MTIAESKTMPLIRRTVCRSVSSSMMLAAFTISIAKLAAHHNPDPNERRYTSSCGLISNYINLIIGHLNVQDITSRTVDKYIQTLRKTPAVSTRTHRATTKFLTDTNVEKIIKLLRCAFKQAVLGADRQEPV